MRKRRDFDYEYDYDLDEVLAEMEFFSDENEEEIDYKDKMIKYYLSRQEERIDRKQFVIERGLLDIKKQPAKPLLEKKKTKEERDIVNSMKSFSRFIKPQDHERMVNNLIKERQLREIINQLKQFHKGGLTGLDQIEKFIELNKKSVQ